MSHEIGGKFASLLLSAEFRRDGLEFFDQSVSGVVASHGFRAVVDDIDFANGIVIRPGADIRRDIRRHVVETGFQQNAVLETCDGFVEAFVKKPNAP